MVRDKEIDPEDAGVVILHAVREALEALVQMRTLEGLNLVEDIDSRTSVVLGCFIDIENRVPLVVDEYRERLWANIQQTLQGSDIDEQRFATEVVLFAERSSVTEEIVRAKSHLAQITETLRTDGAIGRKLDFLLQEVNREVNTVSSKSSDLVIADAVVRVKSELEKIREQVQNLE